MAKKCLKINENKLSKKKKTCWQMFIEARLVTAKRWKNPNVHQLRT